MRVNTFLQNFGRARKALAECLRKGGVHRGGPVMIDRRTRETLVEAAAGAWRPRQPGGGVGSHPAWHDLDATGREQAFEVARSARRLESALDMEGLSSTSRGDPRSDPTRVGAGP
jgi:hypothetical protein